MSGGQLKYLAENFAKTTVGTEGEKRWATLMVRFILGPTKLREMSKEDYDALVESVTTTHNEQANSGCDRCLECGCKYWENDHCIDCRVKYDPAKFKEAG